MSELDKKIEACIEMETSSVGSRHEKDNIVILMYELGRVARSAVLSEQPSMTKEEKASLAAEMCGELADIVTQAFILFKKVQDRTVSFSGASCEYLIEVGIEKQQERMMEILNGIRNR